MTDLAIRVENLGKMIRIGRAQPSTMLLWQHFRIDLGCWGKVYG